MTTARARSRMRETLRDPASRSGRSAAPSAGSADESSQIAPDSFGHGLDRRGRFCIECRCAEHGAPVGRSPPRSTTRKRKVGREGGRKRSRLGESLRPGTSCSAVFLPGRATRARAACRSSTLCEKKTSQIATSRRSRPLTAHCDHPSVRDCTEYGASEVDGSPSGSRFGGGQSESRTKTSPARCIFFGPVAVRFDLCTSPTRCTGSGTVTAASSQFAHDSARGAA